MKWKMCCCFILFTILVLLNIYDTYSTNILISSGQCYELNPIVRFLIEKMGMLAGMIVFKGIALLWVATFLVRARTERMWNILTVGLIICVNWYGTIMYFLNYKAMLLLGGAA